MNALLQYPTPHKNKRTKTHISIVKIHYNIKTHFANTLETYFKTCLLLYTKLRRSFPKLTKLRIITLIYQTDDIIKASDSLRTPPLFSR